jgi:hypothetical protein
MVGAAAEASDMTKTVGGGWWVVGGLLSLAAIAGAVEGRPGSVQLSDGTVLAGRISPANGAVFRFHDGITLHTLAFAQLGELRLIPETEELRRHMRMPEPGRTVREEFGEPYPLRTFRAAVALGDGTTLTGRLYATSVVVETRAADPDPLGDPGERRKLVIPAKQQGENGTTLAALVYPTCVRFSDQAAATTTAVTVHLTDGPADEFAAVAWDALTVLTVRARDPGRFAIATPLEPRMFLALRRGTTLVAGWPEADPALHARMAEALAETKDFFDDRRLLGVWREGASPRIDTLTLLYRQGGATNGDQKPWHLEILRWHCGSDDRLMLAARATLLRGISPTAAGLPTVTTSARLWAATITDGLLELAP